MGNELDIEPKHNIGKFISGWLTDDEMDAIEDMLFTETNEDEYLLMRPLLLSAWTKLCIMDDVLKGKYVTEADAVRRLRPWER